MSYNYSYESRGGDGTTYSYSRTEYSSDNRRTSYEYSNSSTSQTIITDQVGFGDDVIRRTFDANATDKFGGQVYQELKERCLADGVLFEDDKFPADDRSLFYSRSPPRDFEWKRPQEIVSDPKMFVGGHSRFDVSQGMLGDCWFLAGIGSLTQDCGLLHQVVPKGQSFDEDYCGIFYFRFWHYGGWKEVVIDDRIPTYDGNLVFVRSDARNEFWSALLEKAYAKLNGSYEALRGGQAGEAMEDFTGGLAYSISLDEPVSNLYEQMKEALDFKSLICAAIEATDPNEIELKLDNGLVKGHAYTISSLREVTVNDEIVRLVRVRNPWGNDREWNGPWSDESDEWTNLSEEERESIGLEVAPDGEFWISVEDFHENFNKLEICMLSPNNSGEVEGIQWQMVVYRGSWQKYLSAGGCRNYPDTFHVNPQYTIEIEECTHEDSDHSTLVVGLMQKDRRRMRRMGRENLTIGFAIYEYNEDAMVSGKLSKDFFLYNRSVARTAAFTNAREVVGRFTLPEGKYIVIPSTFSPDEEGDFVLRVFAEKEHKCKKMDADLHININRDITGEDDAAETLQDAFNDIAGENGEINAFQLRDNFGDLIVSDEINMIEPSLEACRSMVAFMDDYRTGRIDFEQFRQLYKNLIKWKKAFDTHDVDESGDMTALELRGLLLKLELEVDTEVLSSVVLRYANQDGKVNFDDVIQICCRITTIYEAFRKFQGRAFSASDFMQTAIYT